MGELTPNCKPVIITVMDDLHLRLDQAHDQIRTVRNKRAQRDLYVMLRPIERALTQLSGEAVQCRRLQRATPRYEQLQQQCVELLDNLEKHLLMARLMFG